MDSSTGLEDLTLRVRQFVEERNWGQFHNPKDLAIGLVTEAAELVDLFRFKSEEECLEMLADPTKRGEIGDELSDVLYFLLIFADKYRFDLSAGLAEKLGKNAVKYPIDKAKGSNKKYTEL